MTRLRLVGSPVVKKGSTFPSLNGSEEHKPQFHSQDSYSNEQVNYTEDIPQLIKHEESTTIELFYDLFFVANLTTFTSVHEVNSRKALTSYIGFFCVLWFTWCQTSLYDVRFMADSWLERLAKACHLAVMVGLSIVGPNYDTEGKKFSGDGEMVKDGSKSFQTLALFLMASRFVLAVQYAMTGVHLRKYVKTKVPLGLLSLISVVAGIIYLVIAFAAKKYQHSYRAFYVLAAAEMIFIIAVSACHKVASFKGTHLVERMSLLTLYILGEGVIDILKSTGKLAKVNNKDWSASVIGVIVAAICAVYLLYMLYFDCLNHRHFGSIRQQIWAFAHFPFHAVLVLAVTGMAQFVKWNKVVEAVTPVAYFFEDLRVKFPDFNSTAWTDSKLQDLWTSVSQKVNETIKAYPVVYTHVEDEIIQNVAIVQQGFTVGNESAFDHFREGFDNVLLTLSNSIFETYGFEAGKTEGKTLEPDEQFNASVLTLATVFVYYFIAAGLTIIIMGALSLIMDTHHGWRLGTMIRFASHFVIGLGVGLISIAAYTNRGFNLLISPWIIPIYTISIMIVLGIHHIKWGKKDLEHDINEYAPDHQQHAHP